MKTPEAVVFDLGKVLVDFDYGIAAQKLSKACKDQNCDLKSVIDQSPLLLNYETGLLTTELFYKEFCAASEFEGGLKDFCPIFSDIFWQIDPMVSFHRRLREAGIPIYIFSNTNPLAVDHIREKFPFFREFDGYIFSYEHGAMKPQAKLYEVVEKMSGKRGKAILYIDDRLENVEAGAARGWQVIHHCAVGTTLRAADDLGLPGL